MRSSYFPPSPPFLSTHPATTDIYPLSPHHALVGECLPPGVRVVGLDERARPRHVRRRVEARVIELAPSPPAAASAGEEDDEADAGDGREGAAPTPSVRTPPDGLSATWLARTELRQFALDVLEP